MNMQAIKEKEETTQGLSDTVQAEPILSEDGLLIDPTTGQIIGDQLPDDFAQESERRSSGDVSTTFVDYLLSRYQRTQAKSKTYGSLADALIEQRAERLAQIAREDPDIVVLDQRIESLTKQADQASKSSEWFRINDELVLKKFAQKILAGVKDRTWKSPSGYGSIALRSKPALVKVVDEAKAIETAEKMQWEGAVKRTLLVSSIPKDFKLCLIDSPESAESFGFTVVPEDDTVSISTGK